MIWLYMSSHHWIKLIKIVKTVSPQTKYVYMCIIVIIDETFPQKPNMYSYNYVVIIDKDDFPQ